MAVLLFAPYLPVTSAETVGDWDVVPIRKLADSGVLPGDIEVPVKRLLAAYEIPRGGGVVLGAAVVPHGGHVGSPFARSAMPRLQHALLAGSIVNNHRMVALTEDDDPNAGHGVVTSENALLYGQPIGDGQSYATQIGVLVRAMNLSYAPGDEPLPKIAPPVELPRPLFASFDSEIASATFEALTDDQSGRRLHRALDWYRLAFANAEAVSLDVRVGAARSALEALTGAGDKTKKLVRAYGALVRTSETREQTYEDVFWANGPVQLTPDELWLTRLCDLRNAIVHGDELPDELWEHESHHQLNHIHDRLLDLLVLVVSEHSGDAALRLPLSDRSLHRASAEAFAMLQRARESAEPGV